MAVFETAQSALVWVQGMQAMGKSIVTVIGLVAAVFFLYLLWQEPPQNWRQRSAKV